MNFLENVLGKSNPIWKYVVTLLGAFIATSIGGIPLTMVIIVQTIKSGGEIPMNVIQSMDASVLGISENLMLFLTMLPFAIGLLAVILLVKYLHERSFSETVNGTGKIRWNRIFLGGGVWFVLMFIFLMVQILITPENFTNQFNIKTFIPLFFIALIFIPFQITFEELLFRGYLAQGFGAWTKSRWFAVFIPAILFGLMHSLNPEIEKYGFFAAMPQYIIFGLIFGFASVLDDGIELAIGMHAANNLFACLFVTFDAAALKMPTIFYQHSVHIHMETITLTLAGLFAFFFFAYKYKWCFGVMNKKIIQPKQDTEKGNSSGAIQ